MVRWPWETEDWGAREPRRFMSFVVWSRIFACLTLCTEGGDGRRRVICGRKVKEKSD